MDKCVLAGEYGGRIWRENKLVWFLRGASRERLTLGPICTVGLCLGPYGDSRGLPYERGTPVERSRPPQLTVVISSPPLLHTRNVHSLPSRVISPQTNTATRQPSITQPRTRGDRCYALTPNTVELIPTLGALPPRGGPVQGPVLTRPPVLHPQPKPPRQLGAGTLGAIPRYPCTGVPRS